MEYLKISQLSYGVSRGFFLKKHLILKNIDFSIEKGSFFGIIGHNGAGKTSLLQLIMGVKKPTDGSITLMGHSTLKPQTRLQMSFLPERPYFYEHLTAMEFLKWMALLSQVRVTQKKIMKVLETVGLEAQANYKLSTFSKGMLQRVGLAQCFIHDPSVIILDEPMSGLDVNGRDEILHILRQLSGQTVCMTSHHPQDIKLLCTDLLILKEGQVVKYGPMHAFKNVFQVQIIYNGDPFEHKSLVKLSESQFKLLVAEEEKQEIMRILTQKKAEILSIQASTGVLL